MNSGRGAAMGRVTRGTTGVNRLRRIDRFVAFRSGAVLRAATNPLVVDLGFGGSFATTLEMAARLRAVAPRTQVVGVEIDSERVAVARAQLRACGEWGVQVRRGGFELGSGSGGLAGRAHVVRAANVLRQYEESEVTAAWSVLRGALAPGGIVVDATCDELGRVATWVTLNERGPVSLTVSLRLAGLECPSVAATRLPKSLIHRNVPGTWVHELMRDMAAEWAAASALGDFGARARFVAICEGLVRRGWDLGGRPHQARWRLGELTVPYVHK